MKNHPFGHPYPPNPQPYQPSPHIRTPQRSFQRPQSMPGNAPIIKTPTQQMQNRPGQGAHANHLQPVHLQGHNAQRFSRPQ